MRLRRENTFDTLLIGLGLVLLPRPLVEMIAFGIGMVMSIAESRLSRYELLSQVLQRTPESFLLLVAGLLILRPATVRRLLRRRPLAAYYSAEARSFWVYVVQILGLAVVIGGCLAPLSVLAISYGAGDPGIEFGPAAIATLAFPIVAGVIAILLPTRFASLLRLQSVEDAQDERIGDHLLRRGVIRAALVVAWLDAIIDKATEVPITVGWELLHALPAIVIAGACFFFRRRLVGWFVGTDDTVCGCCGLALTGSLAEKCPECRLPMTAFAESEGVGLPAFWVTNWFVVFGVYFAIYYAQLLGSIFCLYGRGFEPTEVPWILGGVILGLLFCVMMIRRPRIASAWIGESRSRYSVVLLRLAGVHFFLDALRYGAFFIQYQDIYHHESIGVRIVLSLVCGLVLLRRRFATVEPSEP